MFISLQAWQNFPPTGHISLNVFRYFFPSRSQNFQAMSFPSCLFFTGLLINLGTGLLSHIEKVEF